MGRLSSILKKAADDCFGSMLFYPDLVVKVADKYTQYTPKITRFY